MNAIWNYFIKVLVVLVCSWCSLGAAQETKNKKSERAEQYGFIYGLALGVEQQIYRGYDNEVFGFPIIGYRGEKLRVFGPFVRYLLSQGRHTKVLAKVDPRFDGFDQSDAEIFEGMDEREDSIDVGLGFNYERNQWKLELSALGDALGRSNGKSISAKIGRAFSHGPIFMEPHFSITQLDSKYVDYYYGVKATEVQINRPEYNGSASRVYDLGFSISTPIFFGGFTRFLIEYARFDSDIADSPLIDTESSVMLFFAFSKYF